MKGFVEYVQACDELNWTLRKHEAQLDKQFVKAVEEVRDAVNKAAIENVNYFPTFTALLKKITDVINDNNHASSQSIEECIQFLKDFCDALVSEDLKEKMKSLIKIMLDFRDERISDGGGYSVAESISKFFDYVRLPSDENEKLEGNLVRKSDNFRHVVKNVSAATLSTAQDNEELLGLLSGKIEFSKVQSYL